MRRVTNYNVIIFILMNMNTMVCWYLFYFPPGIPDLLLLIISMLHFYHIAFVSYHLEEPTESSKSSNAGFIIRAAIGGGSSLLVLLLLTGGCALWLKEKAEKAIQQNYLFGMINYIRT